jgi:hypothetical protein
VRDDDGVDDLLKSRHDFDEADLRGDRVRLASLLMDDFRSIGERGFVLDKDQWMARHTDFRYLSAESLDLQVSRYDKCAIMRDVHLSQAVWQGRTMTLRTRRSQVWIERPDGWKLAALQFSSLPQE